MIEIDKIGINKIKNKIIDILAKSKAKICPNLKS